MFEILKDIFRPYNPKKYWSERDYYGEYKTKTRAFATERPMLTKELVDYLKTLKFRSFLEVGCNFGKNLKVVSDNFKNVKIAGLDLSAPALENAKEFLEGRKIQLVNAEASDMPFKDKEFDVVVVGEVLEHVAPKDFDRTLDEVSRVAKSDIILITPVHDNENFITSKLKSSHAFTHDYAAKINARADMKYLGKKNVAKDEALVFISKA